MTTSEILDKAADLIEERGWMHGGGWPSPVPDPDQKLCLEGGIMAAMDIVNVDRDYVMFRSCPAYIAVHNYLQLNPTKALFNWNDNYASAVDPNSGEIYIEIHRTQEEVVEVLRAAAVIEAARENITTKEKALA